MKGIVDRLRDISRLPEDDVQDWLERAQDGATFLQDICGGPEVLLYGRGPHALVHGVLAPTRNVCPPDKEDLLNSHITPEHTWCIQRVYGGNTLGRVCIEPPLTSERCRTMEGGEKLIFRRPFEGVDSVKTPIEISQKLVHSLGLYFVEERHAYCRLDTNGDVQSVIKVYEDDPDEGWDAVQSVSILTKDLATYMALTSTALVLRFDFTRFLMNSFPGWKNETQQFYDAPYLFYRSDVIPRQASYINGCLICRTELTEADLIAEWEVEEDPSKKRYATFKIFDRKNGRLVETSCSPQHIVNYFTKSDLPWEISPAFFNREVLVRYKSDPEKYSFRSGRGISCRNAWHLETFDINEEGQVHTYIGYLARLPYLEQRYWQSFNEWPKGGISKQAFERDYLGKFSIEYDPLDHLKARIRRLDELSPHWWKHRGSDLVDAVLYPVTDSIKEWGDELLSLDQLVVEGFYEKGLRELADCWGARHEESWRSLKLVEVLLRAMGLAEDAVKENLQPLRELHALRNPAKAHGEPRRRTQAVKEARATSGTLRQHFKELTSRHGGTIAIAVYCAFTFLPKMFAKDCSAVVVTASRAPQLRKLLNLKGNAQ